MSEKINNFERLGLLATSDFDKAVEYAAIMPELKPFFDTWAKHCGAPKLVFIGHTVKMIVNIKN